jgi:hypothetical protein
MQRAAAHGIAVSSVQTAEGVSAGPRSARH